MPHLSERAANDILALPERIKKAEERNRFDGLGAKVLVGSKLLRELLAAHEALEIAQRGLLRALDYRAATPEGLAIKGAVRDALIESGFKGPMGEVGSG